MNSNVFQDMYFNMEILIHSLSDILSEDEENCNNHAMDKRWRMENDQVYNNTGENILISRTLPDYARVIGRRTTGSANKQRSFSCSHPSNISTFLAPTATEGGKVSTANQFSPRDISPVHTDLQCIVQNDLVSFIQQTVNYKIIVFAKLDPFCVVKILGV